MALLSVKQRPSADSKAGTCNRTRESGTEQFQGLHKDVVADSENSTLHRKELARQNSDMRSKEYYTI
jgi:hypothetical protein